MPRSSPGGGGGWAQVELTDALFLCVAPSEIIQDSLVFWIPRCGFRIMGSGFRIPGQWNLDFGFQ